MLSEFSPALLDSNDALYPPLEIVRNISRAVALAVAIEARRAGVAAGITDETSADENKATHRRKGLDAALLRSQISV